MLTSWDAHLGADSAEAALYIVWLHRHLKPALAAQILPERPDLIEGARSWLGFLRKLDEGDFTDLMTTTLDDAAAETGELLGADVASWRWGEPP